MRNLILLFVIFSAFLFSCRNETSREVRETEEAEETRQEVREMAEIEDTIEIYRPRPGEKISSPYTVEGRARGTYYFEGSFGVRLLDADNREIMVIPAEAQDSWMTQDWVDFKATLEFEPPATEQGFLVFDNANPSGKEEFEKEVRVPIEFSSDQE